MAVWLKIRFLLLISIGNRNIGRKGRLTPHPGGRTGTRILKINSKIVYSFLAMALGLAICAPLVIAGGEEHVSDGALFDKQTAATERNQVTCYESAKYLVVAKEVRGETGTDFLIKYKSSPSEKLECSYVHGKEYFEIKNEWAEYFFGLKHDLLILDSTTGPGPSGLIIWDLVKRKKVYEGSWSDAEETKDDTLVYWLETGEATDSNCPELAKWKSQGLEGAVETKVILNLTNFQITKTRQTRCSSRQ